MVAEVETQSVQTVVEVMVSDGPVATLLIQIELEGIVTMIVLAVVIEE